MNKILKFGATWCTGCNHLSNTIKKLPEDQQKLIEDYDIDTCDPSLVSQYNVRGVPTMIVLNDNGEILKRVSGSQPLAELSKLFTL